MNIYTKVSTPMYETYKVFSGCFDDARKIDYDGWMTIPEDYKAAALFIRFFDQITLAWHKTRSFYAEEEEAVETIMQYLMKNVPIIEATSRKFHPAYIYKVAYNCLYCISHDRKCDKDRCEYEISNIVAFGDGDEENDLDIFQSEAVSSAEDLYKLSLRERFWNLINNMDEPTQVVVQTILGGSDEKPWLTTEVGQKYLRQQKNLTQAREMVTKLRSEANAARKAGDIRKADSIMRKVDALKARIAEYSSRCIKAPRGGCHVRVNEESRQVIIDKLIAALQEEFEDDGDLFELFAQ